MGIVKKMIRMSTDASAAEGMASRKGLGKLRHIEVNQLWLQDKVGDGEIMISNIKGESTPADTLTKHVDGDMLKQRVIQAQLHVTEGRHPLMPEVAKDEST